MKIGCVCTSDVECPTDRGLIGMGCVVGDGLLGEIVIAVRELEAAASDCGYYGGSDMTMLYQRAVDNRKRAWLYLFDTLKQIETKSQILSEGVF